MRINSVKSQKVRDVQMLPVSYNLQLVDINTSDVRLY